jgi:raffinose/stachyose/melibiose transport system permease protein
MSKLFRYTVMLFVVVISIAPLVWVLLSSFKNNMEVLESALTWPSSFSFVSYVDAIKISSLHIYFLNSLFISVVSTILPLIIFGMAAYVLARFEFRGKNFIFIMLGFSLLIPLNSMIQPIYYIVNFLNLYDTKMALILVYSAFGLPIALFLLKSFYSNIPREMEEAAYMEGSGFFKTYLKIIMPLSAPVMSSAGIILFLGAWNEFLFALLLTSSTENRTIALSLNYFVKSFSYDYPALFAALIMIILPSVIIYVVLQEQITKSFVAGAVKG